MGAILDANRILVTTVLALSVLAGSPDRAAAWGRDGHRIVCEIAWQELSDASRAAIRDLLSVDPGTSRFHEACYWADLPEIRKSPRHQDDRIRHYVNIPPGSEGFNRERDCSEPCVVEGIERYGRRLADPSLGPSSRLEALKFFAHFVGDVHQPLHAGYARDRGGNQFRIRWRGRATGPQERPYNLHFLWDTLLIDAMDESWSNIARELHAAARDVARPLSTDPVVWTNESFRLVEDRVYRGVTRGQDLRDAYAEEQSRLVRERLKEAGLRLGHALDAILDPASDSD